MKDHLAALVRAAATPVDGLGLAREYLQARILASLQRAGAMVPLAFHGGTALRILFAIPRTSMDLDFALERDRGTYDLRRYLGAVRADLAAEGYRPEVVVSTGRTVHSAFVRFGGLPFELGLSPRREEKLRVKVEVDTRPPAGAGLATTVVRRHLALHLQHHDRSSLLAGKLHAVLTRPYTKGRDLFDLLWYLSDPDWPAPNLLLLNNALRQTGWEGGSLGPDTWRQVVLDRVSALDWGEVIRDVEPFVEPGADLALLTKENLARLLA